MRREVRRNRVVFCGASPASAETPTHTMTNSSPSDVSPTSLQTQIDEINALKSIYQDTEQLHLNLMNPDAMETMENAVSTLVQDKSHSFSDLTPLTLSMDFFFQENITLHLEVYLPLQYPQESPPLIQHVSLQNASLDVSQWKQYFQDSLIQEEYQQGEEVLFQFVENVKQFVSEQLEEWSSHNLLSKDSSENATEQSYSLAGIHFHHIYADSKKQAIRKKSAQHNLAGWWKSGKPGRTVILGEREQVNEWIAYIKSLRWQQMTVRVEYDLKDCPAAALELVEGKNRPFEHVATDGELKHEMAKYDLEKVFFELVKLESELSS